MRRAGSHGQPSRQHFLHHFGRNHQSRPILCLVMIAQLPQAVIVPRPLPQRTRKQIQICRRPCNEKEDALTDLHGRQQRRRHTAKLICEFLFQTISSTRNMQTTAQPVVHHQHQQQQQQQQLGKKRRRINRRLTRTYIVFSIILVWLLTTLRTVLLFKQQMRERNKLLLAAANVNFTDAYYVDDHEESSIVHVIQTRFMQMQPGLEALAKARLLLFQSFTLPSMQQQTSQRFLWIIRTDPELNANIMFQLKRLVATVPNAVLVASNQNPEGFRGTAIDDITEATILEGHIQLVRSYYNASATRRLLETRLDADDALHIQFCESMQALAMSQLNEGWLVWCAERHVEWHYVSPWPSGTLLGLETNHCVTPGLTYGYMPGIRRSQITIRNNHASLHKRLPPCTSERSSSCLTRIGPIPLALRARTPTSAGMDGIIFNQTTELTNMWREAQPKMWKTIPTVFGIHEDDLKETRSALEKDMPAIVQDALSGQCTKGHSCKTGSRQILQSILNITTKSIHPSR